MLDKSDWSHMIPHTGSMCLLDAVVAWTETTIHATTMSHARADNPLRAADGLHAINLAEYGAQAMAVHGALRARAGGREEARPGMLVSLRDVQLAAEYVDGFTQPLDVHAECLIADDSGAQYTFRIEHGGELVASGRAAVIHPRELP
jgi:predicted hotdog family 3-hydroxylacyl-ACP dehydratase